MLRPGSRIGDYEIVRHASTGGMSAVYEGREARTGQPVAVKVLHAEWFSHTELTTRFINEARALERIRHPRIVRLFATGQLPGGPPYMVLEWLALNLEQALAGAGGVLAAPVAIRLAWQIADAIGALHDRGLVHRDLKPANVLVPDQDLAGVEMKLSDLGLAKALREETPGDGRRPVEAMGLSPVSTGGNALFGTWDYMAPEQWVKSKEVDPKTDVYALGVLLFQMLSGTLPFVAVQPSELMGLHLFEPPPLDRLAGGVDPKAVGLLARMLGKRPAPRPSMHEVSAQLAGLLPAWQGFF